MQQLVQLCILFESKIDFYDDEEVDCVVPDAQGQGLGQAVLYISVKITLKLLPTAGETSQYIFASSKHNGNRY